MIDQATAAELEQEVRSILDLQDAMDLHGLALTCTGFEDIKDGSET